MASPYRIFLAKIPASVTKENLSQHFSRFGPLTDVYIPHNPTTRQSKGMAFISFESSDALEKALACEEHILGGETLEVKRAEPKPESHAKYDPSPRAAWSRYDQYYDEPYNYPRFQQEWSGIAASEHRHSPRPRLFIREVADSLDEEVLRRYFEQFGSVTDVYLPVIRGGSHDGKRKGICYITFKTESSLNQCLAKTRHEIDGIELPVSRAEDRAEKPIAKTMGRPLPVMSMGRPFAGGSPVSLPPMDYRRDYAPEPRSRVKPERASSRSEVLVSPKRIFVGGIPTDMPSDAVSNHFKEYGGEITDIYFPKDMKTGAHRGFCYITFAEDISVHRAVANAPREINGTAIGDVKVAEARPDTRGAGGRNFDEGSYGGRGGYEAGGYDRGGYDRGGYDRGGYDRGGYDRGDYDRGGYQRGGYDRVGYDRGGLGRSGLDRYDRGGFSGGAYGGGGFGLGESSGLDFGGLYPGSGRSYDYEGPSLYGERGFDSFGSTSSAAYGSSYGTASSVMRSHDGYSSMSDSRYRPY